MWEGQKAEAGNKHQQREAGGAGEHPSEKHPSQNLRTQGGEPTEDYFPTFITAPCIRCNFIPTPIHSPQLSRGRSHLVPSMNFSTMAW